jgi:hypothetical protein
MGASNYPRAMVYCPSCLLSKRAITVKLKRLDKRKRTFECPLCGLLISPNVKAHKGGAGSNSVFQRQKRLKGVKA